MSTIESALFSLGYSVHTPACAGKKSPNQGLCETVKQMLLPWVYYWMFLCKAGRKLVHASVPFELVSQAITYHD